MDGEHALNAEMLLGAGHCHDQIPGGFRTRREIYMPPTGLRLEGWLSREALSLASGKSSRNEPILIPFLWSCGNKKASVSDQRIQLGSLLRQVLPS